jgi:hypothetical protein
LIIQSRKNQFSLKNKGVIVLKKISIVSSAIFVFGAIVFTQTCLACTVGVASGKATSDGRPMIWKTRDGHWKNNIVIYNASFKYKFIGVTQVGSKEVAQGVNEKGFAIITALSKDLRKRVEKRNFRNSPSLWSYGCNRCGSDI